ncbi:MAG TPA: hypothetical protein VFJ76_05440, partial [Solirubrobacterales bacterium]|nr:hypothetical protein [Solirubrobacterales bacterium]
MLVGIILTVAAALAAPSAQASKEVVDYFGTADGGGSLGEGQGTLGGEFHRPTYVAVNQTGAGPAAAGEIYVVESGIQDESGALFGNNRIQRFSHDDGGTPSNPYDDSYQFLSAWGTDVDATPSGGSDYEICTVAAECKAGVAGGGNGTPAGNGTFSRLTGIAVDQDTGRVYAVDPNNSRVDVYEGDGTFLRSFGWDVAGSGPGDTGTGYEVCVAADGDVCKAGAGGSGTGQIGQRILNQRAGGIAVSQPDGNPTSGTVFVADVLNHRVDTFGLDGSAPSSFGSGTFNPLGATSDRSPETVAVDSRGIVYAGNRIFGGSFAYGDTIERYDSENANGGGVGFLPPLTGEIAEGQRLTVDAAGGRFRLGFGGD